VSEPEEGLVPYRVVYAERVRQGLIDLVNRAPSGELRRQVLAAAKAIDARLRIYPQFGEPLRDLQTEGETLWLGAISPLTVHDIIDDPHQVVFIVTPLRPLPRCGL
jgi:hypothetical protein